MPTSSQPRSPLTGVRVLEFEALGPVPFAAMMLGQMGAEVVRIVRPKGHATPFMPGSDCNEIDRHRVCELALDLKREDARALVLALLQRHDVLIEGYRPGVMERLGLGPDPALRVQPALVYGRMTGWGQDGPLAQTAGHDINYIGLTGALHAIGRRGDSPVPPLSLIGDYGGGAMFLVAGVLAGLVSTRGGGRGTVIDAAIVDGVTLMLASVWARFAQGTWRDDRGCNMLDGGAPFYDTYRTRDGRYMAVGALEPRFFDALTHGLGLHGQWHAGNQMDRAGWPSMRGALAAAFGSETQNHWQKVFESVDACVSPVLSLAEAASHPHNISRGVHRREGEATLPSVAPRFGGSVHATSRADADEWLRSLQLPAAQTDQLATCMRRM